MAGGALENDDFDAFYDVDDFGVVATIDNVPQKGMFRRLQVEMADTFAVRPTFRCDQEYAVDTVMTIDGANYIVVAVEVLDARESRHILRRQ